MTEPKPEDVLPIGVGDRDAQKRFLERYKPFLFEYPDLKRMTQKIFLRTLKNPEVENRKQIEGLDEYDPRVIAYRDKTVANFTIFYLGRICVDDFGEIIVLAGDGRGVGARSRFFVALYERIVTAAYIAQNPLGARFQPPHFTIRLIKTVVHFVVKTRSDVAIAPMVRDVFKQLAPG